ncbi:ribonucleoside-diphosphate reductase, adenosylcobalamin-dependent [Azospirillum sp. SYSU D00513]|uniref:TSCPD domain-containing protein n=1 Tax=Azospirillum sp. SYSU D00513 TaxID=2812561 RepID=UPI001A967C2F|nr:ribonucleoside-diphosphate reductase, adenosylcobalamin-dependent [Azospirillum sp. SYSU D00513]
MNAILPARPAFTRQPVSDWTHRTKYAFDGEEAPIDTFRRVSAALFAKDAQAELLVPQVLEAMADFAFLPAGRLLAGSGTGRSVTLFNCFVMGRIEDDLGAIFAHLREAALTMQQGGGIGYDFSSLRPKGAPVLGVGADASGPLSFMDVWDSMCRTIMSAGSRRGAMMATLRCDHPDIEAFIDAKREPGRLRMFNLSVLVTDAFMEAVKGDQPWPLVFGGQVFRTVQARELWDRIMQATYAYAEPGVIFVDRVNQKNNLHYVEDISATNPCLTPDSLVLTKDGWLPIAELTEATAIYGSDGHLHAINPAFRTGTKPVYRLRTEGGVVLKLTADHKVLTENRGDVPASELLPGDALVTLGELRPSSIPDGQPTAIYGRDWISSLELVGESEVWDLTEPDTHHFIARDPACVAGGLVVHNCGEQPLPPYGACLLGSINLASLVLDPFTPRARLDMERLKRIVPLAVRSLDNAIDVSNFPLPAQAEEARNKRRQGLGVTGLADALVMCGITYGSDQAVEAAETWLRALTRSAYLASVDLAREKGAFPAFSREHYLAGGFVRSLDGDVQAAIAEHGIRNALLTSIAPTGTISLFANNVSSGIEPVFSWRYTRTVLEPDGSKRMEEVYDAAYLLYCSLNGLDPNADETLKGLPAYFVDAQTLPPEAHVRMQAAAQKHIDSSISKTINCPEDLPFEAFKDVYRQAFEAGCKGCTTYRPNPVTGSVLTVKKDEAPTPPSVSDTADGQGGSAAAVGLAKPLDRPEALPGETYKVRWPDSDHAMYITINDIVEDGHRRPFEVFINSKNMEHYAWTVALTRMISAVFRRGGDVSFVVEELKAVFDPRGGAWMNGRYVPSLLAAIGDVIERHMKAVGMLAPHGNLALGSAEPNTDTRGEGAASSMSQVNAAPSKAPIGRQCPSCLQMTLVRKESCDGCLSCDYSKCS